MRIVYVILVSVHRIMYVIVVKMSSKIAITLLLLGVVFTTSGCSIIMKYILLGSVK